MTEYPSLIESVANKTSTDAAQCKIIIDAYFKEITEQISKGEDVALHPDFGHIAVKESGGREAGCGETLTKKRFTPVLKITGRLKSRLRQNDADYAAMLREHGLDKRAEAFEK